MQVTLPESETPARVIFHVDGKMTADRFYDLCQANPDLWMELTREGDIVIMPPAGMESSFQSGYASRQLGNWADRDQRGEVFDSSGGFALPDGSVWSPDAAWVSRARLATVTPAQKAKFAPVTPEFVIEVMSPSDRLATAQAKMQDWIRNGVQLAWLIQPRTQTVYIYRQSGEPTVLTGVARVEGEGPVTGFTLDLARIWRGL